MLIIAVVIHAICTFGYHFIDGMLFLCTLRFVQGMTYGMASTVIATTVASIVPESRRGEGIGYFTLSITLGSAIGPFLGIRCYSSSNNSRSHTISHTLYMHLFYVMFYQLV